MVRSHHVAHWYPTAAYLYVLWLDALALAWDTCAGIPTTGSTGCAIADAGPNAPRIAGACACWKTRRWMRATRIQPAVPVHTAVVQLHPDADPPPDAATSRSGASPATSNCCDGKRLALIARSPGHCLRFALAPGLEDGMAVAYAYRGGGGRLRRHAAAAGSATCHAQAAPAALLELHTLRALDATLAGASLREVGRRTVRRDAVPPTGTATAACAPRCAAWCGAAMR